MNYLFTSESVSEGHPDKVADQISDAVLDQFLARDPKSKVACETLVTTGQVIIAGEVKSDAYIDLDTTAPTSSSRPSHAASSRPSTSRAPTSTRVWSAPTPSSRARATRA